MQENIFQYTTYMLESINNFKMPKGYDLIFKNLTWSVLSYVVLWSNISVKASTVILPDDMLMKRWTGYPLKINSIQHYFSTTALLLSRNMFTRWRMVNEAIGYWLLNKKNLLDWFLYSCKGLYELRFWKIWILLY